MTIDSPGFWDTLWALVPLGLAGAFSWLPVTGVVVLLVAGTGMRRVWAFVVGRVFGLALITVAFVAGARALPAPRSVGLPEGPLVAGAEVFAGIALVAVGALTFLRRDRERSRAESAWQRRMGEASLPAVFLTSVVVDLQPKGLVLGLSSGVVLRAGSMPFVEAVVAVVLYLALAASSVLVPVVATYAAPVRTRRWLRATQAWLERNGSVLTAAVLALVGVVLVVDGLGRF
ncbi:GAP family protein [Microlunatus flavus]|uniref:Sap, sulfolipid-1-addressing protein n=1 Tax=Microlunatus flavus TaxID=1036181 RepID=A0A1H9NUW3_9ACTN|nr:GAP family protein [Microlunatus flavus]SER39389.1 Sap, sulfolipid-1-addressing protein [Microlunatus flavus]